MIQPLAYVHPQAKVANNVIIDPFVTIEKNVEIGEGTWIGHHATIMEGARIGRNCRIFPGAVISAIPQDLKFDGEETTVHIGDNTTIREFVRVSVASFAVVVFASFLNPVIRVPTFCRVSAVIFGLLSSTIRACAVALLSSIFGCSAARTIFVA